MKFRAYPKIHRLGKEEVEDILDSPVVIQEKIDGANISIWLDGTQVKCGSRTRELPKDESFRGFQEAVKTNLKIQEFLLAHPYTTLYGEWLVKHTITYPDKAYNKIYLFDIYDHPSSKLASQTKVAKIAKELDLEYPTIFLKTGKYTEKQIKEYVGKSAVLDAANGEGVVIKSLAFKNKFGDHVYAKLVHEQFKEANAIVFGGNDKHSDSYEEMYVVNKYCTLGRVQKIMNKLQSELDHKLDMKETPEVAGRSLHDMITEEAWEIFNRGKVIDTRKLKGLATRKFIQLYHDVLNNSISVADGGEDGRTDNSIDGPVTDLSETG